MPVRAFVTQGTTADCTQAIALIDGFTAEKLLADKGYDTDEILAQAEKQGMETVIPPKKSRKEQRGYDKELYKARHLIENAFLHLKRWRGIATRYAKNAASFLAAIQIRTTSPAFFQHSLYCLPRPRMNCLSSRPSAEAIPEMPNMRTNAIRMELMDLDVVLSCLE